VFILRTDRLLTAGLPLQQACPWMRLVPVGTASSGSATGSTLPSGSGVDGGAAPVADCTGEPGGARSAGMLGALAAVQVPEFGLGHRQDDGGGRRAGGRLLNTGAQWDSYGESSQRWRMTG
jgi:hypothetical protein